MFGVGLGLKVFVPIFAYLYLFDGVPRHSELDSFFERTQHMLRNDGKLTEHLFEASACLLGRHQYL